MTGFVSCMPPIWPSAPAGTESQRYHFNIYVSGIALKDKDFFFSFLGLHQRHMEVPRLEVKLELQLQAYTTATATWDRSHICDLHHSSWQHRILNPLREAKEPTCILRDVRFITAEPQGEIHHWAVVFFFFFCLFRATPIAYGGSQVRGLIKGVAAIPSHVCDLHHSSGQCQIL